MTEQYTQQKIKESPHLKAKERPDFSSRQEKSRDVYSPRTIKDQAFPYKKVAQEVAGPTMNTFSGQIFKVLNFTQPVTFGDD